MKTRSQVPILLCLFAGALHAAGPVFSAVLSGSGQEYATSVTSDTQGNVYVAGLTYSSDFPVTAGAFQTRFAGTCDAFVAKVGPDGKLIWSTFLGGILDDWATGIALDSAGNVVVTGYTRSANFPLSNAIQSVLNQGASGGIYDAFVAKLDPSGAKLLYSTFLGGMGHDGAAGLALDAAGNAYVAITTQSAAGFPGIQNAPDQGGIVVSKLNPQGVVVYSFFHRYGTAGAISVDATGSVYIAGTAYSANPSGSTKSFGAPGTSQAMVFKLSPDGSKKIYETTLGGSVQASGTAIAVNGAGEAYVAGSTSSVDFPLVRPFQSSPGARPLWKTTDSANTWTPFDNLPFALLRILVVDPTSPNTVYSATGDLGLFKSTDGGATWTRASTGIAGANIQALTIDPVHPQTLYAATSTSTGAPSSAVYKTVNGAGAWTLIDSPQIPVSQIAVDAQNPNIVYEVGGTIRKSTDAGVTWNSVTFPGRVQTFALDPRVSGRIFAASAMVFCGFFCSDNSSGAFYRSDDGSANWTQQPSAPAFPQTILVDGSTNPSTLYIDLGSRSVDGGVTWTPITPPSGPNPTSGPLAADPSGTLYAAVSTGIFVSRDHAQTWTPVGTFVPPPIPPLLSPGIASLIPAGSNGTLYAVSSQVAASGFVTRLSADGSTIAYSTYLRGHASTASYNLYAAEPDEFSTQNWISAIALDPAGSITVAGGTRSADFPSVDPARPASGLAEAFVATFSSDGSKLTYSTCFGGSGDDGALGAWLDTQGNVIFAGQTWSGDFPAQGGAPMPFTYGDAFVVKLAKPGPPLISSVLNGADYKSGIVAGSWAMIKGTNLANTYPGRTWRSDEIVNGALPASLDGVSVTINGKPAFIYYISPTQINVQAPSDTKVGAVNVVVTNNGAVSAAAPVQLQAVAPAFFLYGGTNYAVATRFPDNARVSDPSVVAGAVAAKPGDTLTLWATGFGATDPPVAAGVTVSGAPAVTTPVTVTVGGVAAQVLSAVLSPGSVGVYQVAIQLPSKVPGGAVAVQASIGGVQSQTGVFLFVGAQ